MILNSVGPQHFGVFVNAVQGWLVVIDMVYFWEVVHKIMKLLTVDIGAEIRLLCCSCWLIIAVDLG